ncbi:short-chain dehydrogenase protein (plasmid) [Rhizobium etli 8C-3]|uniref:Short-chain dehydrogenase protein n=1 Tax=Rhizobium etli 8C-3 TaxID=538025 RepID=A0A1L5PAV8_RHIET|nr:SDR family NAD(P)-dependent oxidoreductase [Rhizobium etli]APO77243.1 short-chain dehydrogenase protein [Rhizobium etli 8C-3]
MRPTSDDQDGPLRLAAQDSEFSRRRFLQLSAIGASAGLVSGPVFGEDSGQLPADTSAWTAANIPDQRGRRVLVTGGNGYPQEDRSGLGYHVALGLARAGADVTIASRNRELGEEAVRRIGAAVPGAAIHFETLDLANLASVRQFADSMSAPGQSLDLLVNNAGVMGRLSREASIDGFERVFATNTLGHFTLTALLLPMLQKGRDPRIVWVGSSRMSAAIPFDDLQQEQKYDYAAAYDNTKLANLTLALDIERRSKSAGWGVASLAAHPGVARTSLIPNGPGLNSREGERFRTMGEMFQPAERGALSLLYAATSPQAVGGGYYGPKEGVKGPPAEAPVPPAAQDRQAATTLWTTLELLGKVSFG